MSNADCIAPIVMVTKPGWILAENGRNKTQKAVSPGRISGCRESQGREGSVGEGFGALVFFSLFDFEYECFA